MTMSRKSMLSSWSWSRRRTSGFTLVRSSSGAMSAMMSRTAFLHSSLVMCGSPPLCHESPHNQRGIYPQHPERVVEDGVDLGRLDRRVQDEAREGARRVEVVDVYGRVDHQVVKRRKVPCQLQGARGAHAVADEALRI